MSFRGKNKDLLQVLDAQLPPSLSQSNVAAEKKILEGTAYAVLHRFPEADSALSEAEKLCALNGDSLKGYLLKAHGQLQIEKGNYASGSDFFLRTLAVARQRQDRFLESLALLDLGQAALLREHFDEAIVWSNSARDAAEAIEARLVIETALGNLGWCHYKTGDPDRALELFDDAEKRAKQLGSLRDEVLWLTTTGYIYLDEQEFTIAEDYYRRALRLAQEIDSKEDILDAEISLAFAAAQAGHLEQADQYAQQAILKARADGNRVDELYPLLARGIVSARSGSAAQAEELFVEVSSDPKVDASLKWETQHELANLYLTEKKFDKTESTYRAALTTFEEARAAIQHEGLKLPFLGNANSLYDDYVQFLISQGKTEEALRVADYSRAQTLAEGLGLLKSKGSFAPPAFDPKQIARRMNGTVLFYWLGPKQSYLWAITPRDVRLFPLPPAADIDSLVQRFRKAVPSARDLAESGDPVGPNLYSTLLAPAKELLPANGRVIIIPDESLNTVSFEALVVAEPKPHYWIEDATILNASSLRMLASAPQKPEPNREKLLLIGDATVPTHEYGELPNAKVEMDTVAKHFTAADEQVFAQGQANPQAYMASHPERFAYIHFVAHGTASRLSPLDSAVVLSKAAAQDDSFKLYAREIMQRPLRADLVTISACHGAGSRTYSGEGLVGLSWAFLRAGAHNVIGALWEVSDASTPQLMDKMYAEIANGKPPDQALRAAKLSLLHSDGVFRKPFYWAPFQLYTGS